MSVGLQPTEAVDDALDESTASHPYHQLQADGLEASQRVEEMLPPHDRENSPQQYELTMDEFIDRVKAEAKKDVREEIDLYMPELADKIKADFKAKIMSELQREHRQNHQNYFAVQFKSGTEQKLRSIIDESWKGFAARFKVDITADLKRNHHVCSDANNHEGVDHKMMERLREDNTEFDRKVERFEKDNTERDQKVERLEKDHAELNHKMEQLQDNETLKIWIERLKRLEQENTKLKVQVEALHALVAASREHDPFIA
jgi:hypothetical protein